MEWLRKIRDEHGYTSEEVAVQAGISRPAYTNIENGKRRPSVSAAMRIATALEFDWTKFFDNTEVST